MGAALNTVFVVSLLKGAAKDAGVALEGEVCVQGDDLAVELIGEEAAAIADELRPHRFDLFKAWGLGLLCVASFSAKKLDMNESHYKHSYRVTRRKNTASLDFCFD